MSTEAQTRLKRREEPGLDTLFVTSIRPDGVDVSDQPMAGGVFALRPGVRGLPEAACLH